MVHCKERACVVQKVETQVTKFSFHVGLDTSPGHCSLPINLVLCPRQARVLSRSDLHPQMGLPQVLEKNGCSWKFAKPNFPFSKNLILEILPHKAARTDAFILSSRKILLKDTNRKKDTNRMRCSHKENPNCSFSVYMGRTFENVTFVGDCMDNGAFQIF